MARLIYLTNVSLDGYIEDESGNFDWPGSDDEFYAFITDLVRPVGTYLYGRRLYESMAVWEPTPPWPSGRRSWPTSRTSGRVRPRSSTPRPSIPYRPRGPGSSANSTRLRSATSRPRRPVTITVGGAALAGHAFRAGLVDECQLLVRPVVVGGGKPALPSRLHVDLELLD